MENKASPWSNGSINLNKACEEYNPSAYLMLSKCRKLYIYDIIIIIIIINNNNNNNNKGQYHLWWLLLKKETKSTKIFKNKWIT